MPTIPVRNLSQGGILKDVHSTAPPLPYWSNGRNVVFKDGKAMRAPIWRNAKSNVGSDIRFCIARTPSSGYDELVVARDDGSLVRYKDGVLIEASETGFTPGSAGEVPWTGCFLGDVLYINRQDRVPRCLLPDAETFEPMPRWDSTWRCRVLRQFNDGLVALNVTKGATAVPSMVKVSDITFYGDAPQSWDSTDPTTLAYENPLAQLDGPILDGLTLADRFLFYTAHQCWEMRPGGTADYTFRLVDNDSGIIGTNCIVALDGKHYVFGYRDIYVTDGQTVESIADGKIREWLYRTMNIKLADRCFAAYNPQTNSILFGHVSGDPSTAWKTPTGCNNAAEYCLTNGTWTFIDLPNVSSMTLCNMDTVLLYETTGDRTFNGVGGSFYDQQDSRELHTVGVCAPLSTRDSATTIGNGGMILGYDFVDRGQLAFEVEPSCLAPSFVERTGIALDSPQEGQAPLTSDKEIRAIYPEVTISREVSVKITLGSQMTSSGNVSWVDPMTFDPTEDYKVDGGQAAGRYLAVRFDFDPMSDTEVSGFDVDVVSNGNR